MSSSGPSRATSCAADCSTAFDFTPTPWISASTSGSGTRHRYGSIRPCRAVAALSSLRAASSSTRCITPTVSGLPQAGQSP
jgi:hypothetical protein